jgi:hypothetical protein
MAGLAKEAFTTPRGNLKWTFVDGLGKETEQGSGEYKYQTVVRVAEADAKEAIDIIDNFWKENKPKAAKPRPKTAAYKYEEDEETGERTGFVLFGMSTVTSFPSGDKKVVKLFTAKAPVREVQLNGKKIGDESIGRGMGTLAIYEYNGSYGTTLFLDAISLSKFVEYVGGVDASSVEVDEDAEDIGLDMATTGTDSVQDEEPTDVPRT